MLWNTIERELARDPFSLFGELLDGFRPVASRHAGFAPVTLTSDQDAAQLQADLPGVDPASIDISVEGHRLTLRAERGTREPRENERYHRRERPHGTYERTISLPFRIEVDEVEATYEHGVLSVRLPRAKEERPRRIEVRSALESAGE